MREQTAERVELLRALAVEGKTQIEAARLLAVTKQAVGYFTARYKISWRKDGRVSPRMRELVAKIEALSREDISKREAARRLGVPAHTIGNAVYRYGIRWLKDGRRRD